MKLSIIIPTHNSEKYISECINSIITQQYYNIEIIIVDDGSTDNTVNIIKNIQDQRIRLFEREHGGVSKARNFGIKQASGDYFIFVDSDDVLTKNAAQTIVNLITKESVDIIRFNGFEEKNKKLLKLEKSEHFNNERDIEKIFLSDKKALRAYCVLFAFSKKLAIEPFDENLEFLEDLDFIIKNTKNKTVRYVDEYLYIYKDRKESCTKNIGTYEKRISQIQTMYEKFKKDPETKLGTTELNTWRVNLVIGKLNNLAYTNKKNIFIRTAKNISTQTDIFKVPNNLNGKRKIIFILYKYNLFTLLYILLRKKGGKK